MCQHLAARQDLRLPRREGYGSWKSAAKIALDAPRAWQAKAAGLARGTLGDLSTKQFLRAQTRARALLPPSLGGKSPFMFQHYHRPPVSFDEFAFTIVVSWIEPGNPERSFAEFPFMRLRTHSELGDVNLGCGVFTFFPTAGPDHEAFQRA